MDLCVCAQFDVSNRCEPESFDDLSTTKLSRRAIRNRFGGLGVEFGGIWSGFAGLDDDDEDQERKRPGSPGGGAAGVSSLLGAVDDEPTVDELGSSHRRAGRRDAMLSGFGMVSGITAELRKGGTLPDGLELVSAEH